MIKEKSKNRLSKLEQRRPRGGGSDGNIPITPEAQALLSPYYHALLASHKSFHFAGRPYTLEEVFIKCVAEQMALRCEDGFCGCDEGVVGIEVATRVTQALQSQYGI